MRHLELAALSKASKWKELETQWLAAIEDSAGDVALDDFLIPIDLAVKASQTSLAETMGWAWLDAVKGRAPAAEALELARELLMRLPSGEGLRDEVLTLYRQTHTTEPDIEKWIELSGINSGKSVKRALRFLDIGLQLKPGAGLMHRTDEEPAEVLDGSMASGEFTIRTPRRTQTLPVDTLIENFDAVSPDDFRVLRALRPERITELADRDPAALLIGILRGHGDRIDRDELKLLLAPRYVPFEAWANWWTRARDAIKKSPHLRVEGRSPMMVYYEEGGLTLEEETWDLFNKSETARACLETVEGYLRECKSRKAMPDQKFLDRIQTALVARAQKAARHEPDKAFAIALVIERLAAEGLPVHPEAHGLALEMLRTSKRPARLLLDMPDASTWPLATAAVRQALPDRWTEVFAELMLEAPLSQLDPLGKAVEEAGRGELLPPIVSAALADPGTYVDILCWVWRGPAVKTPLPIPPRVELFNRVMALVGPARESGGKSGGAAVTAMRSKIRAALSARSYAAFSEMLKGMDDAMATAIRRQIERAEGLGNVVQDEMLTVLREAFPLLYVKARVAIWDEKDVLYVTADGLKTKQAELDELVNVKMKENARAIGAAAELGDLSENSEYKFALEERDLLRARLAQINSEMSIARVIEPDEVPSDHVSIGHRVRLNPEGGGEELTITILGPWESDLARRIFSYQTPLARRLLGRKEGDTIDLSLDGNEIVARIVGVESAITHPALQRA